MCILCSPEDSGWTEGRRCRALELLALLEHPGGMQREAALSIGAQLLSWTKSEDSSFSCEEAIPDELTFRTGGLCDIREQDDDPIA